jgi:hypothetical protein
VLGPELTADIPRFHRPGISAGQAGFFVEDFLRIFPAITLAIFDSTVF